MITKKEVSNRLNCSEDDLIWSDKSLNPDTLYKHPDGTMKGELGYWVKK